MLNAKYGSSLADEQWEYLQPLLPNPPTDLWPVIEVVFHVVKGGLPWRHLPAGFPLWQTVYGFFRRWQREHLWAVLDDTLRTLVRKAEGRRGQPKAASLDSESVKSVGHGGPVAAASPAPKSSSISP